MQAFKKTLKQKEAVPILSKHKYSALYGGSRSGKTFILVYGLIVRAAKTQSRHCIIRQTFNSVKRSIFLDTFPKVMRICFPNLPVTYNKTDYFVTLPNGSTIFFAGLDDSRVEKILGMEFSTIYFNEASEMSYTSIPLVLSRLAEKNALTKRMWFDFNPPRKSHWSYWMFIKKIDPIDEEPLKDPNLYSHLLMNPKDNLENIDDEYIKLLERMPKKDRDRFLNGLFGDVDGGTAVYAFSRDDHVTEEAMRLPGTVLVGSDFNFKYNSDVICSQTATQLFVWDEVQIEGDTFKKCDVLKKKGAIGASVVADGTGKARRTSGISDHQILKDAGFNLIYQTNPRVKDKIANLNRCFTLGIIRIHPRCKKLIRDLTKLVWDKNDQLDQRTDPSLSHLVDSLAYLCFKLYPLVNSGKTRTIQL